jgi:hypothetical protein
MIIERVGCYCLEVSNNGGRVEFHVPEGVAAIISRAQLKKVKDLKPK